MSSVVHGLGELEHIYTRHNIKLRTNGCITISSPRSSDCAFSSNIQDLDALISSGTWTAGANRLWFHVELLFDDVAVSDTSMSQAAEDIGIVLCNAELWSQLCLDASLTTHDSNKFLISLSAQSSRNADIRPPKCIPSACLESISMTFHFSTCRRTRNASSTQVTMSRSGVEHTFASTNPINQHSDRQHYCPLSLLGGPQGVLDDLPDRCAPWTLGVPSVYTSPVSSQGSISSNTHSTSSFDTPTTSHRYAIQEFKFEILVQLLDISLRRMMSDYRPVRPGGVVLSTDSGNPKLAAISPALFSPGYVKAVSQRTGLLPTIARAVSLVYRRTSSSHLKRKLKRLHGISPGSYLGHGSTEDSDPSGAMLSSPVEARLWFLTRNRLVDPFACRGLKSLSTNNTMNLGSHEMLDESYDDVGDVMLDGDEVSILDACSDAIELDEANYVDHFQKPSLNRTAVGGEEPWDEDLFWEHSKDEVAYDRTETLEDATTHSSRDDSLLSSKGAFALESGDNVAC